MRKTDHVSPEFIAALHHTIDRKTFFPYTVNITQTKGCVKEHVTLRHSSKPQLSPLTLTNITIKISVKICFIKICNTKIMSIIYTKPDKIVQNIVIKMYTRRGQSTRALLEMFHHIYNIQVQAKNSILESSIHDWSTDIYITEAYLFHSLK